MAPSVSLWLSDPAWLAMDATARGFHAQLVLVAARQRPAGVLPDDDGRWRKWLGLPASAGPVEPLSAAGMGRKTGKAPRSALPDALLTGLASLQPGDQAGLVALQGGINAWVDHLWVHHWKPQVLSAWHRIDAGLIGQQPGLAGQEGAWWSPVSEGLSLPPAAAAPAGTKAKNTRTDPSGAATAKRPPRVRNAAPVEAAHILLEPQPGEPANEGLLALTNDTAPWRASDAVLRIWRMAAEPEQRQSIWDLGVACLAQGPQDHSEARSFLGRLIKVHGEEAVGQAVADLTRRAVRPADAKALLKGMLTRAEGGSAAEHRARQARSTVAL